GGGRERAPDEHAAGENRAAFFPIGQTAERKAEHGVEQREDGAEQAERGVAEAPFAPNPFADAADDLAVEEVHQVDREEHDEGVERARGHSVSIARLKARAPSSERGVAPVAGARGALVAGARGFSRAFQNGCRPLSITASAIRRRSAIASTPEWIVSRCTLTPNALSTPRALSALTTCLAACAIRPDASSV